MAFDYFKPPRITPKEVLGQLITKNKMEEKKKNAYQVLDETFKKIRRELFEEWKLKYPSYYTLERCADKIKNMLESVEIQDEDFNQWRSWKVMDLKIFIADLVGKLRHDYDKRLVRYHGKWTNEKNKLDGMISDFKTKFVDNIGR